MADVLDPICQALLRDRVLCDSAAAQNARREVIEHVLMTHTYQQTIRSRQHQRGVKRYDTPDCKVVMTNPL